MIFQSINLNKFFQTWYEAHRHSDNFTENIGLYNNEVEKWEEEFSELPKEEQEQTVENLIRDAASTWYWDRLQSLETQMHRKFDIQDDYFLVYRSMTIKNLEEFLSLLSEGKFQEGHTGIGVCWAWNKARAEAHHGNFDAGYQKVKLTGRILISAIDLEDTLLLNLCPALGEDEAEIRLHEGQEIEIIALN